MKETNELCKGCFDKDNGCLVHMFTSPDNPCPCGTCLVKSMCKISCKEFESYCGYKDTPMRTHLMKGRDYNGKQ